jgi:AsmA protein
MKVLKYVLIGVAVVLVVLIAAGAYVAATFDPNAYKPRVIQLVKEKKQRTLNLEGDIKLSFWPSIGAQVGRMSLSEFKSDKQFAAVESAHVALKLIPLLSRNLIVDEVSVKGLQANIVRDKSGHMNIDDLTTTEAKQPQQEEPLKFDIAHVIVEDAAINYRDEKTGADYAVSGVNLKTGRIAPDVSTKIELNTRAQSKQQKLDVVLDAKTQLTFNLEGQRYSLQDLALDIKGQAADFNDIAAKVAGNVTANLKSGEFATEKLAASGTAMRGKEKLEMKLDAPKLAMTADKAIGDKVGVVLKMTQPDGATALTANLSGLEGTAKAFRASAVVLDIDRKQGDLTAKARLASPLTGNFEAKQVNMPELKATVTASGPDLPGKKIAGELAGSASVDGAKERAQANLSGKVDASNIKARVVAAKFSPLALEFDVDIDQLDLDRYSGDKTKSKQPEKSFDLSALRDLRANGALRVGSLKASNVKASNVRLEIKANGGRLEVSPMAATLYQGNLSGAVAINAAPKTPSFALKQNLSGISVGPLLHDLANTDTLEGKGNVSLNVTTEGNTVTALKKAVNGTAAVKMTDGAVKGIDIAGSIRQAQSMLSAARGQQVQKTDARQRTDFSELTATFAIRNGVARNSDLSIKSPLLRVGGAGDVNIGEDTIDYTVKASLVASTEGQGGRARADLRGVTVPVKVTGPMASPSYQLDFASMVTDTAKQKIEETITKKLEERLGGVPKAGQNESQQGGAKGGGGLGDALKGIFGR